MKSLTTFIALAMATIPFVSKAQSESTENVLALTFLNPGISYEIKTARYQTLHVSAYMSFNASFSSSSSMGNEFSVYFDPAVSAQYRFYYNFEKRLNKNARTEKNSANYFAVEAGTTLSKMRMKSFYYEEDTRRPVNNIAVLWGMQRNMPGRFSLNFSAGLGFVWTEASFPGDGGTIGTETYSKLNIPVNLGLGIWLGKKEK